VCGSNQTSDSPRPAPSLSGGQSGECGSVSAPPTQDRLKVAEKPATARRMHKIEGICQRWVSSRKRRFVSLF
jgi:hypothetical protein